ncbi:type II secretion system protein GspJ [Thermodesulfobacteriota bacterium]
MAILKNNTHAFTLLELLVAMTMMSIIATSLYASLSIGFKAKENSESAIEVKRSARIVMDLLKQEIISALPPKGLLAGKFSGIDSHDETGNDTDSLTFFSAAYIPGEDEVACDIVRVEIAISTREDTDEPVLVRGITTNLLSPKSLDPYEDVLCSGIESLNLRYYDGYDWLDEWDSGSHDNSLPEAVEISIRFEDKDRKDKGNDSENAQSLTCSFTLPCG